MGQGSYITILVPIGQNVGREILRHRSSARLTRPFTEPLVMFNRFARPQSALRAASSFSPVRLTSSVAQSVLTDRVLFRNLPPPSHASRLGLSIACPNCSTTPTIRRMVSRNSYRLRRLTSPGPNTSLSSLTNSMTQGEPDTPTLWKDTSIQFGPNCMIERYGTLEYVSDIRIQ